MGTNDEHPYWTELVDGTLLRTSDTFDCRTERERSVVMFSLALSSGLAWNDQQRLTHSF